MTKINILEYHVMSLKSQGLNWNPRKSGWNRTVFLVEELEYTWKPERNLFQKQFCLFYEEQQTVWWCPLSGFNLHSRLQTQLYLFIVVHSRLHRGNKWKHSREIWIINCWTHPPPFHPWATWPHYPRWFRAGGDSNYVLIINWAQKSCQQSSDRPWFSPVASSAALRAAHGNPLGIPSIVSRQDDSHF